MESEFLQKTKQLKAYMLEAEKIYIHAKELNIHAAFQTVVKPYADEIKQLADEWLLLSDGWMNQHKPKYVNPVQIKNTYQNILQVSVHCHIPESSKSRFMKHCKAVLFVLGQIELES